MLSAFEEDTPPGLKGKDIQRDGNQQNGRIKKKEMPVVRTAYRMRHQVETTMADMSFSVLEMCYIYWRMIDYAAGKTGRLKGVAITSR